MFLFTIMLLFFNIKQLYSYVITSRLFLVEAQEEHTELCASQINQWMLTGHH